MRLEAEMQAERDETRRERYTQRVGTMRRGTTTNSRCTTGLETTNNQHAKLAKLRDLRHLPCGTLTPIRGSP